MPRYALRLEYDGAPFAGWQRQAHLPTVQAALETALAALDPGPHGVAAAGRTDAGVHARGQVAQADLARDWAPERLAAALNAHLRPHPIAVTACARVAPDWHARFDCTGRAYRYRIVNRAAPLTWGRGTAWRIAQPLDAAAMAEGARHLVGRHDFTTFRAAQCQADSPVRTLDRLDVTEADGPEGREITIHAAARSFLHNQIRSIAGSLIRVGTGAWPPDRMAEALVARTRDACGPVAPPHGLVFWQAEYPVDPFRALSPAESAT